MMENTAPKLATVQTANHEAIDTEMVCYERIMDDIDNFISRISGSPIAENKGNETLSLSLSEFLSGGSERMSNLNSRLSAQLEDLKSRLF